MAASGLTDETFDRENNGHVVALADLAFHLLAQLRYVNEHSFNSFKMRVGKCSFAFLFIETFISIPTENQNNNRKEQS